MPYRDDAKRRGAQRERTRRWAEKNPDKVKSYSKKYGELHRDELRKKAREWYWANREKALAAANERSQRIRYGVPQVLLDTLKNFCQICGATQSGNRGHKLHIDHNHQTGVIRGKLCHGCNTGLGLFKHDADLLRKAALYLELNQAEV